jgi:hypothetical protein
MPLEKLKSRPFMKDKYEAQEYLNQLIDLQQQGQLESADVAYLEGLIGNNVEIIDRSDMVWQNKGCMVMWELGGIEAFDEPNMAKPSIFDGAMFLFERNSGTGDQQVVIKKVGAPKRPYVRHPNNWIVFAQNPTKHGGERHILSGPIKSRNETIVLPPMTEKQVKNFYTFFVTGNNPNIDIDNIHYDGEKDLPTPYRGLLEHLDPKLLDATITTLAKLHTDLVDLIDTKAIGAMQQEGGNYAVDMRDIEGVLQGIKEALNYGGEVTRKGDKLTSNTRMSSIIKKAVKATYSEGMQIQDREQVEAVIDKLPLWNILDRANTGLPAWAVSLDKAETQKGTNRVRVSF